MGFSNKVLDALRWKDEVEEEIEYDEQEDYDGEEDVYEEEPRQKKSFFSRSSEVEPEPYDEEEEPSQGNMRIVLLQPSRFEEAQNIASYLLENKVVVFDLQDCDVEKAINIVNFVSGAIYALDGSIQKINDRGAIFVAVPPSVSMDNELRMGLDDDYGINIADWVNRSHSKSELQD